MLEQFCYYSDNRFYITTTETQDKPLQTYFIISYIVNRY